MSGVVAPTGTPGGPRKLRLFIALTPPAALKGALAGVQEQLRLRLPPRAVKWTAANQMHLTLRFLGDVPEEFLSELAPALAGAAAARPGFELTAEGLGVFPSSRRPRVVWGGLGGELSELEHLQSAVSAATARWGLPVEEGFRAHLTLGRVRALPPAKLAQVGQALADFSVGRLGGWAVNSVELFRSELQPEGASHTRLGSFELGSFAAI